MKISVAVPPVFDFYATPHRFSGLGAAVVAECLRKAGCETSVFSFPLARKKGAPVPLPDALTYLSPYLAPQEWGKLSFFTRYQRFGPPVDHCAAVLLADSPDCLFIACFAFCYAEATLALAAQVRAVAPGVTVVVGGAGVSAYPDYFIRQPCVDFALAGEAEVSVPAFVRAVRTGERDFRAVPNLYWKTGGRVMAPLETRQTGANDILFVLKKTGETRNAVYFSTSLSRGCPKKCRFCSNFLCHGRTFRVIPLDTVRQALADAPVAPDAGKTVTVNFEDDNLLLAPTYFLAVLQLFRERFSGFAGVRFVAENGLDHTRLTPALVETLIQNGMGQFNLSIASTHAGILTDQARRAEFSLYESAVNAIHRHGVPCITYFICGLKGDTPETVVANILYLANLPTLLGISLFYPVPGIPDYTDVCQFDTGPPCLCAGASAFPWNGSLTTGQMVTAFRLTRLVNLLKARGRTPRDQALADRCVRDRKLYTLQKQGRSETIVPAPNVDEALVGQFFEAFSKSSTKIHFML